MADDLPQITELDLSPVIARRDGTLAADARIRLLPTKSTDAYLRQLR
jgi:ATP-grasp domain